MEENKVAARRGYQSRRHYQVETVGGSRRLKPEVFWEVASPLPRMEDLPKMVRQARTVGAAHHDRLPLGVHHGIEE